MSSILSPVHIPVSLVVEGEYHYIVEDVLKGFEGTPYYPTLASFIDYTVGSFHENYNGQELNIERFNIFSLIDEFGEGLNHRRLWKDKSPILDPLYLIFLRVLREFAPEYRCKYPTVEAFLAEYNDVPEFKHIRVASDEEKIRLFHTANWMRAITGMIPANTNKGRIMRVIPQLIEGFEAKYTTSGGPTRATARREAIFQHESGHIKRKLPQVRKSKKTRLQDSSEGSLTDQEDAPRIPGSVGFEYDDDSEVDLLRAFPLIELPEEGHHSSPVFECTGAPGSPWSPTISEEDLSDRSFLGAFNDEEWAPVFAFL